MRQLPSGTVTLLFTDIQGSTVLLRELGDGYADVLDEHRRVLRKAFQQYDGREVDTQGDAFFYAFADADRAVTAAGEAQVALASGPIRVRMGLHTGTPLLTDEGYVGLDVHEAARVCAAGHGGQVLLTRATRDLVDVEVLDLGEHRLKDLPAPVWLFQLGQQRFPPLKSLSNTNLPAPASSFLGRERELEEAAALLEESRLVSVAGPGGAGKTRFAIELASRQLERFPNGVFWVPLATVRDPALVVPTVAQTVGAPDGLETHLADKRALLLLDNFEQVVDAAADVAQLLRACPKVTFLVTSRESLRVDGEREYALPPLEEDEGVALFCARTGLPPTPETAELCHRLDGLPLAIELAAARARVFTVEQLLERLGDRLDLLKGGRGADPRQGTLRATIAWSYDLLTEEERALFARLAVFTGGSTFEAAERVVDADPDALQSLVEKSMVRRTGERFWMLETIREYAAERFAEGDTGPLRRRHAEYFTELLEAADGARTRGDVHRVVDPEWGNLRSALQWSCDAGDGALALRLTAALWRPWWERGAVTEGAAWYDTALALGSEQPEELRARAWYGAGNMAMAHGDLEAAGELLQRCLPVFRRLGDDLRVMRTVNDLGITAHMAADYATSAHCFEQSLEMALADGDVQGAAIARINLANTALAQDRLEEARARLLDVVRDLRAGGYEGERGTAHLNLAMVDLREGDPVAAAGNLEVGIALSREAGEWRTVGHQLAAAGGVLAALGRPHDAVRALAACTALCQDGGLVLELTEQSLLERTREELRLSLGEDDFEATWATWVKAAPEPTLPLVLADLSDGAGARSS